MKDPRQSTKEMFGKYGKNEKIATKTPLIIRQ